MECAENPIKSRYKFESFMKKIIIFLLCPIVAVNCWAHDYPEGALSGLFSVSETDTICFSKGNLRYNVKAKTWEFASSQTTVLFSELIYPRDRALTKHYVSSQNTFDVYGWATSGWDNTANDPGAVNFGPLSVWDRKKTETIIHSIDCSTLSILGYCDTTYAYKYNRYGFGPSSDMTDINLVGTSENYDFGLYNTILNGGNEIGIWRLPSKAEMDYLLNKRNNAKYLRGPAKINNKEGYILLPDNFVMPEGITWHYQEQCTTSDITNNYSYAQWGLLENAGAVFIPSTYLPHARKENGGYNPYFNLGSSSIPFGAEYWTSTSYGGDYSYRAYIWTPTGISSKDCEYPCAVRLVYTIATKKGQCINEINSVANPHKIIKDGQIIIIRGDKAFTITGAEVK